MCAQDIRWHQRLSNYEKAFYQLSLAVILSHKRALSDLEKQGLIQAFEFTHELSWNVMKDYFYYQGKSDLTGSRDATREAFAQGLILDGEQWMEMIKSRNQTSHTYQQGIADEIVKQIIEIYHACFQQFLKRMKEIKAHDS